MIKFFGDWIWPANMNSVDSDSDSDHIFLWLTTYIILQAMHTDSTLRYLNFDYYLSELFCCVVLLVAGFTTIKNESKKWVKDLRLEVDVDGKSVLFEFKKVHSGVEQRMLLSAELMAQELHLPCNFSQHFYIKEKVSRSRVSEYLSISIMYRDREGKGWVWKV